MAPALEVTARNALAVLSFVTVPTAVTVLSRPGFQNGRGGYELLSG